MKALFLSREPAFAPDLFVGRKLALDWAADKLSRPMPENCNLIGEPRTGKTSLLSQIVRRQVGLPPGQSGVYVWVRPVELPEQSAASFWRLLLARLYAALGETASPAAEAPARALFDQLDETIEELPADGRVRRLIFLIDDFDLLTEGLGKQDLDWLRSLATRHGERLAFVISSTDPLPQLTQRIEGRTAVSPFANLFHNHALGLLAPDDAEEICRRAGAAAGRPFTEQDINFLLREAGRHPDLLKIAAGYLAEAYRRGETETRLYTSVASDVRFDGHVRHLCQQLLARRSREEQQMLCALQQPDADAADLDPILLNRLRSQLGLLEERDGEMRLFADAFHYWACQAQTAVAEAEPEVGEETAVAPLHHLPEKKIVHVEGKPQVLTPLENRLLAYLLGRAGSVCSVEELLENVWQPGRSPSVVEKGINRLRGKIEEDPKRPRYILSARGEGYLLRQ